MQYTFSIRAWRAASSRLISDEQWLSWARGELEPMSLPECKPDVAFLPAMQRRRLGLSARLLFETAYPLLENEQCPMIFASRDGEMNRSFELWLSLMKEGSVSPTSFGLSVHNALAGQWSMLRTDMSENTALAAREDGLEMAFLEAAAMLAEGLPRVLVVVAEDPLLSDYHVTGVARAPFAFAVAFLLEQGTDWQLEYSAAAEPHTNPFYWGALSWVQHVLRGDKQFAVEYGTGKWLWTKNA